METLIVRQLLEQAADETFDCSHFKEEDGVQMILQDENTGEPLVWIIPTVLSPQQCDSLIEKIEIVNMESASYATGSLRTSKRTSKYMDEDLSQLVFSQLAPSFLSRIQEADGLSVEGVHPNWRILRYDQGDYFGPHYDQGDISKPMKNDGTKDFLFSSHTLIVNLSKDMKELIGGTTRFYPRKNYSKAVDVSVQRGWAIAFKQLGMLHAGQQVIHGTKYVAQAGLLRLLPEGVRFKPSTFRVGPNLEEAVRIHSQNLRQQQEVKQA